VVEISGFTGSGQRHQLNCHSHRQIGTSNSSNIITIIPLLLLFVWLLLKSNITGKGNCIEKKRYETNRN